MVALSALADVFMSVWTHYIMCGDGFASLQETDTKLDWYVV